jgi:Sec7 domain
VFDVRVHAVGGNTARVATATTSLLTPLQDFLRNNRGINDGGDLPQDYMEAVYDRIVNNEIKMKVWIT